MGTMLDDDLLTVGEAAILLKVHVSTIRRWIAQGDLPAYRVGQRRVALKRADLAKLISPAQPRPLTPEERQRGLASVEEFKELRADMLARRGGQPFPNSWELLNEEREARSRHVEQAVRGDVADDGLPQAIRIHTDFVPRRLTEEEQRRGLEAFERLQRLGEEILARHGREPFPSAGEIINEQRDQRSRELG